MNRRIQPHESAASAPDRATPSQERAPSQTTVNAASPLAAHQRVRAGARDRDLAPADVLRLQQMVGNRVVQRLIERSARGAETPGAIQQAAQDGLRTPAGRLPFAEQVQQSFGRHEVSQIQAHVGPEASASAQAMNARAYATGDHVVFSGTPDLRTVAHEAAHVIQQRGGVQIAGGVGAESDAYERHADAVADAVVQGQSSEALLDALAAPSGAPAAPPVQRTLVGTEQSSNIWSTEIAGRVAQEKNLRIRKIVHLLHSAQTVIQTTGYDALVKDIQSGKHDALIREILQQLNKQSVDELELAQTKFDSPSKPVSGSSALADTAPPVSLKGAQFVPEASLNQLNPQKTAAIRAENSGDMYHLRAALVILRDHDLLIWHVTQATQKQAQQIVDLLDDVQRLGLSCQLYYTNAILPGTFKKTETWATEVVAEALAGTSFFNVLGEFSAALGPQPSQPSSSQQSPVTQKTLQDTKVWLGRLSKEAPDVYRKLVMLGRIQPAMELADKFGAYAPDEGLLFQADLEKEGHFQKGVKYVIVNFRATGHSDRPGANAPALDTGLAGMTQIIEQVHAVFGRWVVMVPMGEEWGGLSKQGPNLVNYWTWKSANNRRKQVSLLKYLKDHYEIVGAIGMRSGVMDQIAFAGIKIISIDISPHRIRAPDEKPGGPNVKPAKGWDRGLKLEEAYGGAYGRVFLRHPREQDTTKLVKNWQGAFHPEDLAALQDAISFYFAQPEKDRVADYRHASHPLQPQMLADAYKLLPDPRDLSCYDLAERVLPYLRHILSHKAQMPPQVALAFERYKADADKLVADVETWVRKQFAQQLAKSQTATSVEWMSQTQRGALLAGNTEHPFYNEQLTHISGLLGLSDDKSSALAIYLKLHEVYSTPLKNLKLS